MSYRYQGYAPTSHGFLESRPDSKGGYHGGADNAAAPGTPVYAQYAGKVLRSGRINGYGMSVVVESTAPDGTKFYQLYGHLGPGPLPEEGTPIVADKPIPGAEVGTTEYVRQKGGISTGPHLHREIISGKAKLFPTPDSLGINSSDITNKADPDTFDINHPSFYEKGMPLPPPQPKLEGDAPKTQPQEAEPFLQRVMPPVSNQPARPTSTSSSPGMAISGAAGPTSIGGPSGPTPLIPPANSGLPWPAPPAAPTLPPLHFAPESPRNSGPFTTAPLSFGAADGPGVVQKPGGLLGMMIDAGVLPGDPNEFASAPIRSPGLVERLMRESPRAASAQPRVSLADWDQPFGTYDPFASDNAAPSQPLYDRHSFAAPASGSDGADDAKSFRVLRGSTRARDGSIIPRPLLTSSWPQDAQPVGLVSGQPMPDYPLAPIFGSLGRPATSNDDDDFFTRWIKPLLQQ